MDKFGRRRALQYELNAAAQDLGFMYAAYTDGDEIGMPPRFDELTRQALKVRDLQRKLREGA